MPISTLPPRITGVIFDCDGVIINSRISNALYYNKILEAFDLPPLTEEQEAYTFMSTVTQALQYIIPQHLHDKVPEVCARAVSYERDIMPHVELNGDFYEFSQWLITHNVRCAVHTNRSNGMQLVVNKFPFLADFSPIITATDVTPKPHPAGVFAILEAWQCKADEVIFVGDSLNDQQAATGANVAFVAFGHEKLDAAVQSVTFKALQKTLHPHIVK